MIAATPSVTPMTAWSALETLTRSPDARYRAAVGRRPM